MSVLILDPLNLSSVDLFVIETRQGKHYVFPFKISSVREARSLKSLPTKTVFVRSKHPHVRYRQHYRPILSKHVDPGVLAKHLSRGVSRLEGINSSAINKLISGLPSKVSQSQLDFILHHYKRLHVEGDGDFKHLDLSKQVNGRTLLAHLLLRHPEGDSIHEQFLDVLKKKINTINLKLPPKSEFTQSDRLAYFRYHVLKAETLPVEERNAYLDRQLAPIVDGTFVLNRFKSYMRHRATTDKPLPDSKIVKDLSTTLDFITSRYGVDKVSHLLNQIRQKVPEFSSLKQGLRDMFLLDLLAISRNPKSLWSAFDKSKLLPSRYKDYKVVGTELVNSWKKSSNLGFGILLRRAARAVLGTIKSPEYQDRYTTWNGYHVQELRASEVPEAVHYAILHLHKTTQNLLAGKEIPLLYRGFELPQTKLPIFVRPTVRSTTPDKSIALNYARDDFEHSKTYTPDKFDALPFQIDERSKKYLKSVKVSDSNSVLFEYDYGALAKDNMILAYISPDTVNHYRQAGLFRNVDINFLHESEAIILT